MDRRDLLEEWVWWWRARGAETCLWLFVVLTMLMIAVVVRADVRQHREDMAACQADGHKEWECRAWLRQGRR